MPPDEKDVARLYDMLLYADEITQTVGKLPFALYQRDKTLWLATERRLEIIGEAARNVSRAMQAAHPEIPWQKIVAQRHVLAHEYGELKQELIYRVVTHHIPELAILLRPLVPPITGEIEGDREMEGESPQ